MSDSSMLDDLRLKLEKRQSLIDHQQELRGIASQMGDYKRFMEIDDELTESYRQLRAIKKSIECLE